jgi:hypothetical protein
MLHRTIATRSYSLSTSTVAPRREMSYGCSRRVVTSAGVSSAVPPTITCGPSPRESERERSELSCWLRIGLFGFGTGRQRKALERCTMPKLSRRTFPRYGLYSRKKDRAGVAKRRRELISHPNPSPFVRCHQANQSVYRWWCGGERAPTCGPSPSAPAASFSAAATCCSSCAATPPTTNSRTTALSDGLGLACPSHAPPRITPLTRAVSRSSRHRRGGNLPVVSERVELPEGPVVFQSRPVSRLRYIHPAGRVVTPADPNISPRGRAEFGKKRVRLPSDRFARCIASPVARKRASKWSCLTEAGGTPRVGYPAERVDTPPHPRVEKWLERAPL